MDEHYCGFIEGHYDQATAAEQPTPWSKKFAAVSDVKVWFGNNPTIVIGVGERREPAPAGLLNAPYFEALFAQAPMKVLDIDGLKHQSLRLSRLLAGVGLDECDSGRPCRRGHQYPGKFGIPVAFATRLEPEHLSLELAGPVLIVNRDCNNTELEHLAPGFRLWTKAGLRAAIKRTV